MANIQPFLIYIISTKWYISKLLKPFWNLLLWKRHHLITLINFLVLLLWNLAWRLVLNRLKLRIINVWRRHIILLWVVFVLRRCVLLLWVLHVLRLHVLVLIRVHLWIIHLYWIFLGRHLIIHWLAWAIHLFVLFWNNIFISRLINLSWILGWIN